MVLGDWIAVAALIVSGWSWYKSHGVDRKHKALEAKLLNMQLSEGADRIRAQKAAQVSVSVRSTGRVGGFAIEVINEGPGVAEAFSMSFSDNRPRNLTGGPLDAPQLNVGENRVWKVAFAMGDQLAYPVLLRWTDGTGERDWSGILEFRS